VVFVVRVVAKIVLGDIMRIEETLRTAEIIDPRLPYWIEKIVEMAGGSHSPHYLLIAAAKLLADSEQIIEDFDKNGF
jgi:hypothetical protein